MNETVILFGSTGMLGGYCLNLEHSPNNIFDIIIPLGPNDKDIIYKQIEYTKKILLDIEIFT